MTEEEFKTTISQIATQYFEGCITSDDVRRGLVKACDALDRVDGAYCNNPNLGPLAPERAVLIEQMDGHYYTVTFLKGGKRTGKSAMAHENKIGIYVANWIQSGDVSDKYFIGNKPA